MRHRQPLGTAEEIRHQCIRLADELLAKHYKGYDVQFFRNTQYREDGRDSVLTFQTATEPDPEAEPNRPLKTMEAGR